jgi:hypothetical protein
MVRAKASSTTSLLGAAALCLAAGVGAAMLLGGTITLVAPSPAVALPAYAAQTGLPCGRCHVNPAGGGPRTAFGKAFAANGHKLPGKKKKR